MKKNFKHIVLTPLTGLGLHNGFRGNSWYEHRIGIFKKYTLNSLINQTDKNFTLWIAVREEERTNPLTIELEKYLKEVCPFSYVITYGGCPIWDDKYRNDNLLERLKVILPQLKEYIKDEEYVGETCQPSDDIYSLNAMEEINNQEPKERRILTHLKGFIFNQQTQRVADWNPTTINPPFYTIMYPVEDFLDPVKHYEYMKNSKSHEDVIRLFDSVRLSDHRYCVTVHEKNISTNWNHPFRGKTYSKKETREILKSFGVEPDEVPVIIGEARYWWKVNFKFHFLRFLLKIHLYKPLKHIKNSIEQCLKK